MKPKHALRSFLALAGSSALLAIQSANAAIYTWADANVTNTTPRTLDWFSGGSNTQAGWNTTPGAQGFSLITNADTIQFFTNSTTSLPNTATAVLNSNINNGGTAVQLGTLTLTGRASNSNTRTLTVNIGGDILNFSAATGTINLDANNQTSNRNLVYNVNSNIQLGKADPSGNATALTLTGNGTSTFNIGGIISELEVGGGSVIKSGSSTVTLSGNNSYTGGTSINGGRLIASHTSALGSGTVTMATNTALLFGTSGTFANNISMGSGSTLAPTQNTTPITYGGTITLSGTNSGTSGVAVPSTAIAFSAYSGGDTQTFNNPIGGTGDVAFRGGGSAATHNHNYILKGSASTYTGNTWLYTNSNQPASFDAGNVVLQLDGGALPSTTVLTMTQNNGTSSSNNSVLDLNGNNQTLAGLTTFTLGTGGRGWFVSNTHASVASTLTINNTSNFTFAGVIGVNTTNATTGQAAGAGNIALVKQGAGIQTLSGANTYTGTTTISGGTLQFARQTSLYNNTTASWTAANIKVAGTATLALNVGGTNEFTTGDVTTLLTNLGGANGTSTTGFAAGSFIGFDTTNAAGGTFTVADNIANSSGSGGGAIGLTKLGTNTLVLSGTNTYTGGSTITTGMLVFRNTNSKSGTGTHAFAAGTTLGLGVATSGSFYSSTDVDNAFAGTMTGNLSGITVTATTNVGIDTTAVDFTYATSVAGNPTKGVTKLGANTLTLTGANTYTGATTINAGILNANTTAALGNGSATNTLIFTGGTLQAGGTITSPTTRTVTLTSTGLIDTNSNTVSIAGIMSGAGGLTKSGAGNLTISGANTYTGLTTVSAGTLAYGANNVISTGGVTVDGATAVLDLGASRTDSVGTVTVAGGGSITGSGTSALTSTGSFEMQSGSASAILAGGVALNKTTAGTVTLTGTNTYTGATAVSAGTLQYNGSLTGAGAAVGVSGTGTLGVGASANIARNVNLSSGAVNLAGTVAGTLTVTGGTVTTSGTTPTVTTADFSAPGAGTVVASTPLTITSSLKMPSSTTATLTGGTSFTAAGANLANNSTARTLTLSGGTLLLNATVALPAVTLTNPSFETDAGAANTYQYRNVPGTPITGWTSTAALTAWGIEQGTSATFSGVSGVTGLPNYNASTNFKWAFIQQAQTVSQTFTAAVDGFYTVGFADSGRTGTYGPLSVQVQLNGNAASSVFTSTQGAWTTRTSDSVFLTAGSHTLSFVFTNPLGGDKSSTLDAVSVTGFALGIVNLPDTSIAATASSILDLGASTGSHTLASLNLTAGGTTTALSLKNGTSLTLNGDASNNAISATGSAGQTASIVPNVTSPPSLIIASGKNISVDSGVTLTVLSAISGGAVTKIGDGTLTLGGTNTYTDATTVTAGTLAVNGSLANTSTTIGAGTPNTGTLQGSGSIGGSVTIQSGGTLSPGNSIESLGTGAVSFLTGSTYAYELQTNLYGTTPGVAGDLTDSTGTLDIQAGSILTLTDLAASTTLAADSKLTLISYYGGWTGTELFTYNATTLNDGATFTLGLNQWRFDYDDITGGLNYTADQTGATRFVTMTVIPEPRAALLGGLGLLMLLRRRR